MEDQRARAMDVLLRMIVPFRREFGRMLIVRQFLHDFEYRQDIIAQALQSRDERLREYGLYLQQVLNGPRTATGPAPTSGQAGAASAVDPALRTAVYEPTDSPSIIGNLLQTPGDASAAPAPAEDKTAEELLRDQLMRKYTSGLR